MLNLSVCLLLIANYLYKIGVCTKDKNLYDQINSENLALNFFTQLIFKKTNNDNAETKNYPDILNRLKVVLNIVEDNVDVLRETASMPKVKRQILLSTSKAPKKSKSTRNKKRNSKLSSTNSKSRGKRYDKYFTPKRASSANRFNLRIDPLVKIDTHIPYKSSKTRLFSSFHEVDEESILNKYYPHRFTSPSHSSFSRQPRLFTTQPSSRSSIGKSNRNLSALQTNKRSKRSASISNNSKIVYLSYKQREPDRPFQRYSRLSVSHLD